MFIWAQSAIKNYIIIIIIINHFTARVIGAPQMILQPVFSIFLFSTALWDLPNSRPVHSLMLSSHLFLCPPGLLLPFTVPCKMVLARPDERETWPYHCSMCLFTMVRRSSCGPTACWILARTSSLGTVHRLYHIQGPDPLSGPVVRQCLIRSVAMRADKLWLHRRAVSCVWWEQLPFWNTFFDDSNISYQSVKCFPCFKFDIWDSLRVAGFLSDTRHCPMMMSKLVSWLVLLAQSTTKVYVRAENTFQSIYWVIQSTSH